VSGSNVNTAVDRHDSQVVAVDSLAGGVPVRLRAIRAPIQRAAWVRPRLRVVSTG